MGTIRDLQMSYAGEEEEPMDPAAALGAYDTAGWQENTDIPGDWVDANPSVDMMEEGYGMGMDGGMDADMTPPGADDYDEEEMRMSLYDALAERAADSDEYQGDNVEMNEQSLLESDKVRRGY